MQKIPSETHIEVSHVGLAADFAKGFVLDAQSRTTLALELLVQNCLAIDSAYYASKKAFLKEALTVRLTSHRRAGHTTAALKIGDKYFKRPAFVFYDMAQAKRFAEAYPNIKKGLGGGYVASHKNFDAIFRGMDPDCIVVDIASMLSRSRLDDLYDLAVGFPSLKCIMLVQ